LLGLNIKILHEYYKTYLQHKKQDINFILILNNNKQIKYFILKIKKIKSINMGIGDWGLGIGDWGLGPIPNPQSPIPNPQSPIPI